jgi:hypothetical protein
MKGRIAGLVAAALLGGCGGPNLNLQQLLSLPPPAETGTPSATETAAKTGPDAAPETGSLSARYERHETSALVAGTPTSIFAEVARGALGCWFAADGPLKASHVYRAEAQPPAKGGDAEIVIHERDASMSDRRGPRAYRVAFTAELSSVRVTMTSLKFEPKLAQAMAKDVESWAKGGKGADSCQLRALLPPPAPPKAAKTAKTAKTSKAPSAAKGQSAAKSVATDKTTAGDKKK